MSKKWGAKATLVATMLMSAPTFGIATGSDFGTARAECTAWKSYNLVIAGDKGAFCYGVGTGCKVCVAQT